MLAFLSVVALAASPSLPPEANRRLVAEAQMIVRSEGDHAWPGLSQAPLPILLIGSQQETLFCGPATKGFQTVGFDPVTRCVMQARPRELPVDLAAATDLGSVSVIQMGLPEAIGATRGDWIVTFLHEAFHQYQTILPAYVPAVEMARAKLGQTGGQWMLDYPFPYSDPNVKSAFSAMTSSAARFLAAENDTQTNAAIRDYIRARKNAQTAAGSKHWLYYEFQVGQEGVARWVELRSATHAGKSRPDIEAIAAEQKVGLAVSLRAIDTQGLNMWKRSALYVLGAVEASMLERVRPQWQQDYEANPFSMGTLLDASASAID